MASRRSRTHRLLLPTLLAAVIVGEITGLALARSMAPRAAFVEPTTVAAAMPARITDRAIGTARPLAAIVDQRRDTVAVSPSAVRVRTISRLVGPGTLPASPAGSTTSSRTAVAAAATRAATATASSRGTNRVWIPSLGISRSVSSFPCSRTRPPDNFVYRWGCAGRNNVYLLGHSYSVFKPLHDAYVSGRLAKGMNVIYADNAGRVSTYSVIWWRVVKPTTAASWAWAAQTRPSMTLQTCVGPRSEFRLMVRLVQID